jgi:MtN3 and saliva related transmembrane protein
MNAITAIGLIAGSLTTISFLPQVLHTIQTRDTSGLSLGMYAIFTTGVLLWLVYGIVLQDVPIILANGITFALAATVLAFKLRHG